MDRGIKGLFKDSGVMILKIVLLFVVVIAQYMLFSPILDIHSTGYLKTTLVGTGQKIILIYTTILFVKFIDKKDTSFLGIRFEKGKSIKQFGIGALIGLIFMLFIDINAYIFQFVEEGEFQFSIDVLIKGVLLIFIYTLIVGISEEILFRGYVLNLIRSKCSDFKAVIILSVIFLIPHINSEYKIFDCLDVFLMGAVLGFLYIITRSLYMSIGLHFMCDFIQEGIFRVIDVEGSPYLPIKFNVVNDIVVGGVNLGTEIQGLFVIGEVVLLAIMYLYWKKNLKCKI